MQKEIERMPWELQLFLFILLTVSAIIALEMRDLLAAVAVLGAYSFLTALLIAMMGAIDVAFTEAVLGTAVTGVLFVTSIYVMSRRSVD
jgi:energy-converting hydrogenase B subunit D